MTSATEQDTDNLSALVTNFAITQTAESVPTHVLERVKHSLLDSLGCAIYGNSFSALEPVRRYIAAAGSGADATVLGTRDKVPTENAALLNSTMIHTTELAEGFTRALVHPSTVIVPAVLAQAEREHLSGTDVLVATAVGYELLIRLGHTVGAPLVLEQGLHPPAVLGPFGAAAALVNLRGLDEKLGAQALGIMACAVPTALIAAAYDHATVKDVYQGYGAAAAVQSVDLAVAGITGVRDWLGAWYRSVPRRYDLAPIADRLGEFWHTGSGGLRIKTRPVMAMAQPTTASLYKLLGQRSVDVDEVTDVLVESSKRIELGNIYHPTEVVSARASIPFLVAAALCEPDAFVADRYLLSFIHDGQFSDKRISALQDLVRLAVDPEFDHNLEHAKPNLDGPYMKFEARVTITLASGEQIVAYEDMFSLGTGNMTREQTADKFRAVTANALSSWQAESVVDAVWNLEQVGDIGELVGLLGTAGGPSQLAQ